MRWVPKKRLNGKIVLGRNDYFNEMKDSSHRRVSLTLSRISTFPTYRRMWKRDLRMLSAMGRGFSPRGNLISA